MSRADDTNSNVDRRSFIKTVGAGLLAPEMAASAKKQGKVAVAFPEPVVHFAPGGGLTQLSPNLYLLRDTCNVYVIKDGDRALLIDFGSGYVLKLLGQIGVTKVDAVLHTHHHRDQGQGDWQAIRERIPIHVPAHERHLFADAEAFWRSRRVFHMYHVRNDFFTFTKDVAVTGVLKDYEKFCWGKCEFLIFPTPGHTIGSVSLVGEIDGKKVGFTGDLMQSPGKVTNLFDLQYQYSHSDGVDFAIYSLSKVRELGLDLMCPSHGEPVANPDAGIGDLISKLRGWVEAYEPGTALTIEGKPFAVTPHLICSHQTASTFYALISDTGKALFVDYGSASKNFCTSFGADAAVTDRMRFVEHTIPYLKARYGLKTVDVAIPSHMHDDHLNGFPHLVRHYGTQIWCLDKMVDVLQNPRGYNLGCILAEPIKIDRVLHHGETFRWEEFEFRVFHSPGHTEYQMAMFTDMDGARVVFTGDAFFPRAEAAAQLRHNLIFRNWVEDDSHLKSMRTIMEQQPTLVAPGHGRPFVCNKEDMEQLKQRLEIQQQYFRSVIADPDCNFGLNPSWARLYPYQPQVRAGSAFPIGLCIRNYRGTRMEVEAALTLPLEWKATPEVVRISAPPNGEGRGGFTVTIPEGWSQSRPRVAIAADVVADGKYLGEIAEGVVDVQFG